MEFISDSDSLEDELINSENIKIYQPKELNDLLLNKTINIAMEFKKVSVMGDITNFKKWKRSGCSFDITMNDNKMNCKVWERDGIYSNDVKKYDNTKCIITGFLDATYFYGHKFIINVISISLMNNDTKLKELKSICEKNGYFKNKKKIFWDDVTKIGIISKKNTQGYDDFCNQFKVPIDINLQEITLEGLKTCKECTESIRKLQFVDLIIIIRGGGDTGEISNSFDNIDLFDVIKKSNVPIITAIGHEQDKDDKLLITNVSDIDFATPTTCAKDLNKKLYYPLILKIENLINYNEKTFNKLFETLNFKLYQGLGCFLKSFLKDKFGGKIIEVNNTDTHIIIKKDGKYYNNNLNFDEEIKFTDKDIHIKDYILDGLEEADIDKINKNFKKINTNEHKLKDNIQDNITNIKKNEKIEIKFLEIHANKTKLYYLKQLSKTNNLNNLLKIRELLLWYKEQIDNSINGEDIDEIKDIYDFIKIQNMF